MSRRRWLLAVLPLLTVASPIHASIPAVAPPIAASSSDPSREPTGMRVIDSARLRALAPDARDVHPGVVIVHRSSEGRPSTPIAGATLDRVLDGGAEVWNLSGTHDGRSTLAAREWIMRETGDVRHVDVDIGRRTQLVPNDDLYKSQWALSQLHAELAWNLSTGDPSLIVAVVDTGVVDHPDLTPRLVAGFDFISDPVNAGDGDGRDGDPTDAGDETAQSSGFHGTHISGIIGAATNNAAGIAGVDWRCAILPVRVLGVVSGGSSDIDIADGIRWAAGLPVAGAPQNVTPARVINLSFGGHGYSQLLQDAVRAAHDMGAIVIASAGNDQEDAINNIPSALEDVMSVAASDPTGGLASEYSNFGARVDVLAPGGTIRYDAPVKESDPNASKLVLSTSYLRGPAQPVYAYAAGTSQAAAHASGVAALVRGSAPALSPDAVAAIMRRTANPPVTPCPGGCGTGILDARKALENARSVEASLCGGTRCGSNQVTPVPLHPEEGCAVSRRGVGASRTRLGAFLVGAVLLVGARIFRRRRVPERRFAGSVGGPLVAIAVAGVALLVTSCNWRSPPPSGTVNDAGSGAPALTIALIDPVPKLVGADLTISVGSGRTLQVRIEPASHVDYAELVIAEDVDTPIARLGHGPWNFTLPSWVLSLAPPGTTPLRVLACIRAFDDFGTPDPTTQCIYVTP